MEIHKCVYLKNIEPLWKVDPFTFNKLIFHLSLISVLVIPMVRMSILERQVAALLTQRGVRYEREKCLPGLQWKSSLRCDFYLPAQSRVSNYRGTIIEVDGPYHFLPNRKPVVAIRDSLKNVYAMNRGLHFLRMDYTCQPHFGEVIDEFLSDCQQASSNHIRHTFSGQRYYYP